MDDAISRDEIFFTDKQLCRRWQCSQMKLWRLRKKGLLEVNQSWRRWREPHAGLADHSIGGGRCSIKQKPPPRSWQTKARAVWM